MFMIMITGMRVRAVIMNIMRLRRCWHALFRSARQRSWACLCCCRA